MEAKAKVKDIAISRERITLKDVLQEGIYSTQTLADYNMLCRNIYIYIFFLNFITRFFFFLINHG